MCGHVVGPQTETGRTAATSVPGIWADDNFSDIRAQVITAAAGGLAAGDAINADLLIVADAWRAQMPARPTGKAGQGRHPNGHRRMGRRRGRAWPWRAGVQAGGWSGRGIDQAAPVGGDQARGHQVGS